MKNFHETSHQAQIVPVLVATDAMDTLVNPHWESMSFKGSRWQQVNDPQRRIYLLNAYRVLLTRARQGMVIFIPNGDVEDPTRAAEFYEGVFQFLRACGVPVVTTDGHPADVLEPLTITG